MRQDLFKFMIIMSSVLLIGALSGCSVKFYKGYPGDLDKISELESKVKSLEEAKALLESRLKDEIRDKQVKVDMTSRGLVVTFVDEVLFDSGKAVIKEKAYPILDKVIGVIKEKVSDKNIGIEGHTDDQPIQHSGWKSNWELSTTRATTVLHYLEESGIDPRRLQATGFGQHRPVTSNATPEGRQQNRRVEIVILPGEMDKVSLSESKSAYQDPDIK